MIAMKTKWRKGILCSGRGEGSMNRRLGARCALIFLCIVLGSGAVGHLKAAQGTSQTFVAQGTAPLQPTNRAQSRAQALEDLLRQAVLQALGTFVPGQVLAQKNKEIRKDILSQAERYAQSFKILGEYADGDLYRVQGAVDVAVGALRTDAEKLGLASPGAPQGESPAVQKQSASALREEPQPASTPESQAPAVRPSPEEASFKRILWAVAENWDGSWHLPAGETPSAHGSLGEWAVQEASDYGWRAELPPSSMAVRVPPWDGESQKMLLEQARRQGQSHVVFGTAQRAGKALEVRLKVVEAASGRTLGAVDERVAAPEDELSEGLLTLAAVTVSKVDAALSGLSAPAQPSSSRPAGAPPAHPSGAWEIAVKGDASYAAWLSMEKRLTEMSKEFAVDSVVLETEAVVVRAKNVDPDSVGRLDGMRVGLNLVLHVEGMDPTARKITLKVSPETAEPVVPKGQESKTP